MPKQISKFFDQLGFPLHNTRWSWGARSERGILLRTWTDGYSPAEKTVGLLNFAETDPDKAYRHGRKERIEHIRVLWKGDIAAYTVIAEADNNNAPVRRIARFNSEIVFPIERVVAATDSEISAVLGKPIKIDNLASHCRTHRVSANASPFPVIASELQDESGAAEWISYKTKLPAMRQRLVFVATKKAVLTYGDLMKEFRVNRYELSHALSRLGRQCQDLQEPILTSLVVSKQTGRCSDGFEKEFNIENEDAERAECYRHWDSHKNKTEARSDNKELAPDVEPAPLEVRARQFSLVEGRPEQTDFRRAVFIACGGRCVISGCDISAALDAAHLKGHDWRLGENTADDGVLLRRDLHGLYDAGLLRFSDDGTFEFDVKASSHYGEFSGTRIPERLLKLLSKGRL